MCVCEREREREREREANPAAALVLVSGEDGSRGGGGRPRDRNRVGGVALPPRRRLGAQILELLQGKAANQGLGFRLLLQIPFVSPSLLLARLVLTARGFPPRAPVLRHYYRRLLFIYLVGFSLGI